MNDIFVTEGSPELIEILDQTIYAGDVDKDSIVDLADISRIVSTINQEVEASTLNSDVNHDGVISILDITQALQADNYAHTSLPALFMNNGYSYNY